MKKRKLQKIGTYSFVFSLGLLLWLGLNAFLLAFIEIGAKEGTEFIWQMVGFSFLLATLVYSVNPKSLELKQRKRWPAVGILFITSGVFVIVGYGMMTVAAKGEPALSRDILKLMGQIFFQVATLSLSGGIAMMTLGFLGED